MMYHYHPVHVLDMYRTIVHPEGSGTVTSATTCIAWVTSCTIGVEVIFPFHHRSVRPRQEVFENSTWVVKVFCPTSPAANLAEWPPKHHGEILAATTAKRVCSIRTGVNTNVTQVVAEALQEGLRCLSKV